MGILSITPIPLVGALHCPSEAVRCLRGDRAVKFEYQGVTRQPYSAARNGMGEGCTAADSCLA